MYVNVHRETLETSHTLHTSNRSAVVTASISVASVGPHFAFRGRFRRRSCAIVVVCLMHAPPTTGITGTFVLLLQTFTAWGPFPGTCRQSPSTFAGQASFASYLPAAASSAAKASRRDVSASVLPTSAVLVTRSLTSLELIRSNMSLSFLRSASADVQ